METIGLLEETVLLLVLRNEELNGAKVALEYISHTKRQISLPAIITVLKRLEVKGLLESRMGESTPERGGKPKRMYKATAKGYQVARELFDARTSLWEYIPSI